MTNSKLQKLTNKWKKILRIQDWRTNVNFAAPEGFESSKTAIGECRVCPQLKQATINIKNEQYLVDESPMNRDIENTLVHELLHIYFDPMTAIVFDAHDDPAEARSDPRMLIIEQAVEQLSLALVGADRGEYVS